MAKPICGGFTFGGGTEHLRELGHAPRRRQERSTASSATRSIPISFGPSQNERAGSDQAKNATKAVTTNVEKEILELEAERCSAMIAGNEPALRDLLHEDMIYTHATGSADTKATFLDAIKSRKFRYRGIVHTKEQVRMYGNTALVSGQAEIDMDVEGAPRTLNLCYLAAWMIARQILQT